MVADRKAWDNAGRVVPGDWKSRKAKVLRRDRGICYVCRQQSADEVDHTVNVAEGGTHDLSNLAADTCRALSR
jgi:5-methylcytosine-specific restriction endonuclease McrA